MCTCAKPQKYPSFIPLNCFLLVYIRVVVPRSCTAIRNGNKILDLSVPKSHLTPKLRASGICRGDVCCTATLLLESLQFTVYFLSSLRKEGRNAPLGAMLKVCFSICVFHLFSAFHSMDKYLLVSSVSSQTLLI